MHYTHNIIHWKPKYFVRSPSLGIFNHGHPEWLLKPHHFPSKATRNVAICGLRVERHPWSHLAEEILKMVDPTSSCAPLSNMITHQFTIIHPFIRWTYGLRKPWKNIKNNGSRPQISAFQLALGLSAWKSIGGCHIFFGDEDQFKHVWGIFNLQIFIYIYSV